MRYFFILFLFAIQTKAQDIQRLDSETFAFALRQDPNVQLVDLRSQDAFDEGHIKNAVSAPYENDNFENLAQKLIDKTRTLFLYCQTGTEGRNASIFLKDLGFKEVYFLDGGFTQWTASSKPYVSSGRNNHPIVTFTVDDLNRAVASSRKLFLFLEAPMCKPCKAMESMIQKNTGTHNGIKLLKLDISKEIAIAEYFNAKETPTFIYFKNGRQLWKYSGEIFEKDLQAVLFQ
jgi:thioredoxin 1